jgi:hypothetical protein
MLHGEGGRDLARAFSICANAFEASSDTEIAEIGGFEAQSSRLHNGRSDCQRDHGLWQERRSILCALCDSVFLHPVPLRWWLLSNGHAETRVRVVCGGVVSRR